MDTGIDTGMDQEVVLRRVRGSGRAKHIGAVLIPLTLGLWAACAQDKPTKSQEKEVSEGSGAKSGKKSKGQKPGSLRRTTDPLEAAIPEGSSLLKASYNLRASSFGLSPCEGKVDLKINAVLKKADTAALFELPSAKMNCILIGELDLSAILGGFSTAAKPEIVVKNNVIHLTRLGFGTYSPERPFLPSFLSSSPQDLNSLNYSQRITVTYTQKNDQDSGTITIKSRGYPLVWRSPQLGREFKKTILFDIEIQGFEGERIDRPMHMLFNRMSFRMSLEPIAILEVYFSGPLKALTDTARNNPALQETPIGQLLGILPSGGNQNGGLIGNLIGGLADTLLRIVQVDLNMTLTAQEGLDDGTQDDQNDSLFDGGRGGGRTANNP